MSDDFFVTPQQLIDEAKAVAKRLVEGEYTLSGNGITLPVRVTGVAARYTETLVRLELTIQTTGAPRYGDIDADSSKNTPTGG